MRLKQLLGVIFLTLIACAMALAADSQLTNVTVTGEGRTTTVLLHADGAFTHTEYRPYDNLLLVDLAGVSSGKLKNTMQAVQKPGVVSYRVLGYKGVYGAEVTRVELTLSQSAVVNIAAVSDGLEVRVSDSGAAATAADTKSAVKTGVINPNPPVVASAAVPEKPAVTTPAVKPSTVPVASAASTEKPAVQTTSNRLAQVRHVSVARSSGGMAVEVSATAPITPSVMRIESPDRLVMDLPNSVPVGLRSRINVNSPEIKAVRVAQFQNDPPVTRVVVDLASAQDYAVENSGNKIYLRLHAATAKNQETAEPALSPAAQPQPIAVAHLEQPKPAVESKPVVASKPILESKPVVKPAAARMEIAENKPVPQPKPAVETKPVVESKPVVEVSKPVVETKPVVESKPAPSQPVAMAANDLVVVQPHYAEKPAVGEVDPKQASDTAAHIMSATTPTAPQTLAPRTSATLAQPVAINSAAEQQQAMQRPAQPANGTPRYTGEPISVNLKDVDLKDFFRLVHEISGLNIILDPNVKGTLTLVLDDVPWDQALDLVLQNNGLDKRLEGNVLRIATRDTFRAEAEARRSLQEAQALSVDKTQYTHFLSYAHAAEILPIVKKFLSARGDVVADPRTNALIITDIPSTIPDIQRVLKELDRKTQQVEIEARVVAATRNFARDIGVQLGFAWGNRPSAVGGAGAVGTSPLQVNTPNPLYFTAAQAIPLFSNLGAVGATSGIAFNNSTSSYRVDAILTLAENRGLLKILSRPRVVTQNNIQASVKQGVRIPVVTAAQLGGPPTTTYFEAALRLQVTPQITAENTIFMQLEVENTTPDFSRQVNGNPSLITQSETTQVLVNDGGTVVIGGVIQTQNSINIYQVPLLGDIPVLGNLFKRRAVSTSTQELMFIITPKIVQS